MSGKFSMRDFLVVMHSHMPRFQLVIALLLVAATTAVVPAQVPTQPQEFRLIIIQPQAAAKAIKQGQPTPRTLTKAEVEQLVKTPNVNIKVMTPKSIAATQAAHLEAVTKMRAAYAQTFANQPHLLARVAQEPSPALVRPKIVPIKMAGGRTTSVVLMNRDAMVRDALLMRRLLQNPDVQLKTYEWLHQQAQTVATKGTPGAQALKTKLQTIATPASLKGRNATQILQAIFTLQPIVYTELTLVAPDQPPAGYVSDPAQEQGNRYGLDRTVDPGCTPPGAYNPNGLHVRCNWPLKYYNTSVKNQAARGTCPAFAICGAVESLIAVNYNRWVNLSEQDLYKHMRLNWFPLPPFYDDGYVPAISLLQQLVTGYYFPFEGTWDYNPSWRRQHDDLTLTYWDSCLDYTRPACSDTNHQAIGRTVRIPAVLKEVVSTACTWIEDIYNYVTGGSWDCHQTTE